MVQEAEQFKAEDEAQRDKVTAKNSLESLAFNMKSTVEDEKLQDKISSEDKKTIVDKCNEVIAWLDRNQVKIEQGFSFSIFQDLCNFPIKMTWFLTICDRRLRRTNMITSRRN